MTRTEVRVVAGVGLSSAATSEEITRTIDTALARNGLDRGAGGGQTGGGGRNVGTGCPGILLGKFVLRLRRGQRRFEYGGVDLHQQCAFFHLLVFLNCHLGDMPAHLRGYGQDMCLKISVVSGGILFFMLPPPPEAAANRHNGDDEDNILNLFHRRS